MNKKVNEPKITKELGVGKDGYQTGGVEIQATDPTKSQEQIRLCNRFAVPLTTCLGKLPHLEPVVLRATVEHRTSRLLPIACLHKSCYQQRRLV